MAAIRLPKMAYDYFASGSGDEVALRRNREAFERVTLRYRVLRGVGVPDTSVVTVDAPVLGTREADVRNRFSLPPGMFPENLMNEETRRVLASGEASGLAQYFAARIDPSLTWADIDWLRSMTRLPVLVKSLVRGDDDAEAVAHGGRASWYRNTAADSSTARLWESTR